MTKKLIRLEDGILVEIEVSEEAPTRIAAMAANPVQKNLSVIEPVVMSLIKPVSHIWQELNKDMSVTQAEIEIGLAFEVEGNIYITKSSSSANLKLTLTIKA